MLLVFVYLINEFTFMRRSSNSSLLTKCNFQLWSVGSGIFGLVIFQNVIFLYYMQLSCLIVACIVVYTDVIDSCESCFSIFWSLHFTTY